jgi:hypothetical protein
MRSFCSPLCSIHWQRFATAVASPLRQIGAFEKSNFWQGRLEPRATGRWAVELFGPAFRAGIAGLEVLGALLLKLSDGSASGVTRCMTVDLFSRSKINI